MELLWVSIRAVLHNGDRMRPIPTHREAAFEIHELFFSITDLKGLIKSGNEVFARVAQYSLDDLIGSPHNIIRHPDMPKSVFRLLWQTIAAGKPIAAYVKNMARDGSYYWVVAYVIPLGDRYLSVRIKPSSAIFEQIPNLYKEMCKAEETKGMDGGAEVLLKTLRKLGFTDYFEFMRVMVTAETRSRDKKLSELGQGRSHKLSKDSNKDAAKCEIIFRSIHDESFEVEGVFRTLFSNLSSADALGEEMHRKAKFFLDFSTRIKFLALNANLSAQRLGASGKTLGVVAGQIQRTSFETIDSIKRMGEDLKESVACIRDTGFQISAARLLLEMAEFFAREIVVGQKCRGQDQSWVGPAYENVKALAQGMRSMSKQAVDQLKALHTYLRKVKMSLNTIVEVNASVGIVHVTGRTEAAQADAVQEFEKTFSDLQSLVERSKQELEEIVSGMRKIEDELQGLDHLDSLVSNRLRQIDQGVSELETILHTA